VLQVAYLFSRFINQEGNDQLMVEISKEELQVVLQSFQKDKSPGPDGLPIELYLECFDFIGHELTWCG
jgi:hypothetical protein